MTSFNYRWNATIRNSESNSANRLHYLTSNAKQLTIITRKVINRICFKSDNIDTVEPRLFGINGDQNSPDSEKSG